MLPKKSFLTLAHASIVVAAARAAAEADGVAVTIVVTDASGEMLKLERMDNAPLLSLLVAQGKAKTAAHMRLDTGQVGKLAEILPALGTIPGVFPLPGGVPLWDQNELVGAIGVSGGVGLEDQAVAEAGARALT